MCSYGHDHIKQQARRKPVVLTPEQEAARRGNFEKTKFKKTNIFIGFSLAQQLAKQQLQREERERALASFLARAKFESEGIDRSTHQ